MSREAAIMTEGLTKSYGLEWGWLLGVLAMTLVLTAVAWRLFL